MAIGALPYAKVIKKGEPVDVIEIKLTDFSPHILVQEEYCVNPSCSCQDALLRFIELSDDGAPVGNLFDLRVDMSTWKVTEKTIHNKMIKADQMIQEFERDIDQLKDKLRSHQQTARKYGETNYINFIPASTVKMILDGNMVGYCEIFGDSDSDTFTFEMNGTERWFVDDQYCSNPKCPCNDVVLTFFKFDVLRPSQDPEFIVRMNINNFKYDIEFNETDPIKVSEVMTFLQKTKPEVFKIIKGRHREVKDTAKKIIKQAGSKEKTEALPRISVGRNDPCPCGSGKKYKKCCGLQQQ